MHRACRPEATWFLGACTTLLLDIMSTQSWSITLRHAHTLAVKLWPQICHCKGCRTSFLSNTHTTAKLLYDILNHRSIIVLGEEHLVCLVTNLRQQIEAIMALWITTRKYRGLGIFSLAWLYWLNLCHTPMLSDLITQIWKYVYCKTAHHSYFQKTGFYTVQKYTFTTSTIIDA